MILIGRPGYNNDDVIISSLALIGRSLASHLHMLARLSADWSIPRSPETTRKEILTVGSPFHTNSLLLLTHTYKHSLRLRLPVPLPVGKSTSGWIQIGLNPLPVGVTVSK